MRSSHFVVFLNGSYGVGKSTVLDHVGDLLAARGQPFSLMDVDWFHRSWPTAPDDPDNVLIEAMNLGAVWRTYQRAGSRQPVASGVIATAADRQRYEKVFGLAVRSIRLEADDEVVAERLRRRYSTDRADALGWHLDRYQDLARRLRTVDQDERTLDTTHLAPRAIAEDVLRHFELIGTGPDADPDRQTFPSDLGDWVRS